MRSSFRKTWKTFSELCVRVYKNKKEFLKTKKKESRIKNTKEGTALYNVHLIHTHTHTVTSEARKKRENFEGVGKKLKLRDNRIIHKRNATTNEECEGQRRRARQRKENYE